MDTGGNNEVREILNAEGVDTGSEPSALPESLTPSSTSTTQGRDGANKLIFGKFKDMTAAEKAYKESQQKITTTSERQKKLDAILNNPELKKWAATNPEIKQALTEAGYSIAEIEQAQADARADKEGNTAWDGDENNPLYRVQLLERKLELREQKSGIEAEIKRPLTPEEWAETKEKMKLINPNMDARYAWRLTDAFQKMIQEREKKAVEAARGPSRNGQRPPPALLPTGEKADTSKRVSKMNAFEKDQYLRGLVSGEIK